MMPRSICLVGASLLLVVACPREGWTQGDAAARRRVHVAVTTASPQDVRTIDGTVAAFYAVISGPKEAPRDWARASSLRPPSVHLNVTVW